MKKIILLFCIFISLSSAACNTNNTEQYEKTDSSSITQTEETKKIWGNKKNASDVAAVFSSEDLKESKQADHDLWKKDGYEALLTSDNKAMIYLLDYNSSLFQIEGCEIPVVFNRTSTTQFFEVNYKDNENAGLLVEYTAVSGSGGRVDYIDIYNHEKNEFDHLLGERGFTDLQKNEIFEEIQRWNETGFKDASGLSINSVEDVVSPIFQPKLVEVDDKMMIEVDFSIYTNNNGTESVDFIAYFGVDDDFVLKFDSLYCDLSE